MILKKLETEFDSPALFFSTIVGRPEIELLENLTIRNFFLDKRILITGAGGTIGSAVARRLANAGVLSTYYLDRDESALHALALSLSDRAASHSDKCFVGDVKDELGILNIFNGIKPDVVIHTAALKHLVVLERFPREGFNTNVFGTLNVLKAAKACGATNLVNVSTDKAALPTSVLGKTKLVAELLTSNFNNVNLKTKSVRFGNVFASRGSVIETFVHQLRNNLPVTITDPDVTRFFMSHNEAANLILATCMMEESAVYVQEMGLRVRIVDVVKRLADNMEKELNLNFIGLESGEKLHEDLYDGEYSDTPFPAIVKLLTREPEGILQFLSTSTPPESDNQARKLLDDLMKLHRFKK
jgi:dTDP-glucose 4,6-dehydratase